MDSRLVMSQSIRARRSPAVALTDSNSAEGFAPGQVERRNARPGVEQRLDPDWTELAAARR